MWKMLCAIIVIFFYMLAHGNSIGHVVILVTLDGIRTQEMCTGTDPALSNGQIVQLFSTTKNTPEDGGKLWGCDGSIVRIGNPYGVSLPAYQSIFTGVETGCRDNECPRVPMETFTEYLVRNGGVPKNDVVTFASWNKIALAVEHIEGTSVVDVPNNVRDDEVTMNLALKRLRESPPSFMYISLNTSDDLAHHGKYVELIYMIQTYDRWIGEIKSELKKLDSHVMLIVTTDHGRGSEDQWTMHGHNITGSENIWLYVWSREHSPFESLQRTITHLDISPSILAFFGIAHGHK